VCILVAAVSWWSDPATWLAIIKGAFGLGLVIFVHELGLSRNSRQRIPTFR
jgi:hypothetical protein